MDPQDRLGTLLDGAGCTVCAAAVPHDRITLLAQRDDLAFVQLACVACGSTTLGFVVSEGLAPEAERLADPTPISADDVLDMHELLDSWSGDLAGLLDGARRLGRGAGPAERRGLHR
jgi:hypothetical protein